MKKELLLAFLSEAIDKGWNIEVSSRGWGVTEAQAMDQASKFSELTEQSIKAQGYEGSNWLVVGDVSSKVRGTFHHNGFMENDVNFDGGEEVAI